MKKLLVIICLLCFLLTGCSDIKITDKTEQNISHAVSGEEANNFLIVSNEDIENPPIVSKEDVDNSSQVMVPILMFHDVRTIEGGEWSMSSANFRKTLVFLLENGYTPISLQQLVDYVDDKSKIPEKPVCITFDDGYFSNYRYVLPIVTELKVPITLFMTCNTIRQDEIDPCSDENILYKLSTAELEIMEASPFVQVQSHTYGLHGENTTYSDVVRMSSWPIENESEEEFKKIYAKDCETVENILKGIGVDKCFALSYPNGRYHEWTEDVLAERGYRVSVTSDFHRVNLVTQGKPESLFLLGRMNVNDKTTEEKLLQYLERK
ncbi:MAG: polysaccharide deacetylase family protein [Clostridia bacterium]|nr:polysaccharide deacetylase family protein [Clostridia bacterium]